MSFWNPQKPKKTKSPYLDTGQAIPDRKKIPGSTAIKDYSKADRDQRYRDFTEPQDLVSLATTSAFIPNTGFAKSPDTGYTA